MYVQLQRVTDGWVPVAEGSALLCFPSITAATRASAPQALGFGVLLLH